MSDKVKQYTTLIKKGGRQTLRDELSEAHSVMYIRALNDIELVAVDHGLISDKKQGKRKSDFLIQSPLTESTHIIELKGANIEEAFEQIARTVDVREEDTNTRALVTRKKVLDGYISSPNRQKIPDIHSPAERTLANLLAARSSEKCKDIFQRIHFVKVVEKQKKLSVNGRQIISSNEAPVEFE